LNDLSSFDGLSFLRIDNSYRYELDALPKSLRRIDLSDGTLSQ
jgi:hypothetical protein